MQSFDPVTPQGLAVSSLFVAALVLSGLVFLLVVGLLGYVLVRSRGTAGAAEPPQVAGNRRLEIGWTVAPALLLAGVFVAALRTMNTVDAGISGAAAGPAAVRVEVSGNQWWWEFRYPDLGVATAYELHAPVGTPLRLELQGADVIHSFWLPAVGWKRDAIPGKTNVMAFRVDRPGVYEGACAEFCGLQHAWMRVRLVAEPRDQFDAWVRQQQQPAAIPQESLAARGRQVFLQHTCVNYHSIQGTTAGGRVGPDLTHVGSRAALGSGVVENTPENLRRWVRDARALKPGALMPAYSLAADDLTALVAYLEGLR